MTAEVELDGGTVGADDLEAVIGRVVGAGVGIAHDHDSSGDVPAGVGCRVVERGQHTGKIDIVGVDVLLGRRLLHQHRRLRRAERPADEFADTVEVDAEGGLAIRLARQQVSDHGHVVAVDRAEQQRRSAIQFLHDGGNLEIRVDRRSVGLEPSLHRHALERRTESSVEDAGIGHGRCLCCGPAHCRVYELQNQRGA